MIFAKFTTESKILKKKKNINNNNTNLHCICYINELCNYLKISKIILISKIMKKNPNFEI